ncbi:MAG: hypothetical protein IJ817_00990 [Clostridia bacterium]|nr:hypothetical protein [Clostridia bacterium]
MKKNEYDYTKLSSEQKQCLSLVESLGIYELRALARVFGDNSPTTLKRNDHIKIVMDKIISGEEIRPQPLRQGRPHKELNNINAILEELTKITGVDYIQKSGKTVQTHKNITFNQLEQDVFSQQLFPIKAKGFILENADGKLYFLNQFNGKYVFVDKSVFNKLSQFDFVEGTAVLMNSKKEYILKELDHINFVPYEKYDNKCNISKSKTAVFNEQKLNLGQKYRFDGLTRFTDNQNEIKKLVQELKKQKISTVAIIPNVADEEFMTIQMFDFDCLITFGMTADEKDVYQNLVFACDFIKHQKELGGSVAIFVQDPVTLANVIDYCFKLNPKIYMNHTDNVAEIVREISPVIGNFNSQTITAFSTCDASDLFDPLYVSLIYKNYKPIK